MDSSCEGMTYGKTKYAKRADLVSTLFAIKISIG
jgi:hypothetical protein